MVHQSQAGCVIGKAGSKLKQLRSDHNIDVKVFPSCCPVSTDRLVRVIGAPNNVSTCIVAIVDLLRTVSDLLSSAKTLQTNKQGVVCV
jgi:heterogeneous nuclear ribonucleoprotein K